MEEKELTGKAYLDEWLEVKKGAKESLGNAPVLRQLLEMDKSAVGTLYQKGFDAFSLENYAEAENLFASLFLFDSREIDYQIALAAALEAQEKFRAAISIYTLAAAQKESPHVYYRMGKCFMGLEDKARATLMFELGGGVKTETPLDVKERVHMEKSRKMVDLLKA